MKKIKRIYKYVRIKHMNDIIGHLKTIDLSKKTILNIEITPEAIIVEELEA